MVDEIERELERKRGEEYQKWKDGDHRTVDGESHGHSSTAKQSDALYDDDSEVSEGITWMLFSYERRMGRKKFFMASMLALIIFWSLLVVMWLVILDWNTIEGFLVSVLTLAPLGLWMQSATVVKRLKDNGTWGLTRELQLDIAVFPWCPTWVSHSNSYGGSHSFLKKELRGPTNLVRTLGTYLYTIIIKAKIWKKFQKR